MRSESLFIDYHGRKLHYIFYGAAKPGYRRDCQLRQLHHHSARQLLQRQLLLVLLRLKLSVFKFFIF